MTGSFSSATRWRCLFSQGPSDGPRLTWESSLSLACCFRSHTLPLGPLMGCSFPSASFPLDRLTHLCSTSNRLLKYAPCRQGLAETRLRLAYQLARCPPEIMLSKKICFENPGKFNSKSPNIQSLKGQESQMPRQCLYSKLVTPFQAHSRPR